MKQKKLKAIVTTVVFVALILGLSIFNICKPQKTYSENENRYLQVMPEFSLDGLFDGTFTEKFELAITDQFVARDFWVKLKNECEILLQKQETKGVYFGKDNYFIEKFDTINEETYKKNLNYIKVFTEKMLDKDIPVKTMLVPTASGILTDKLFKYTPELDQNALLQIAKDTLPAGSFVDVSDVLKQHSNEYIYYRTDHHWTTLGAFYAYNYWLEENNMPTHDISEFYVEILSEEFLGTTQAKANVSSIIPDTMTAFIPKNGAEFKVEYNASGDIQDSLYVKSHLNKKDKYQVYLNGNQSLTKITGGTENGKKLLVVKDSYANTFLPLIANDYEEIYVVDLRFYKMSIETLVEENGINESLVLYNLKGFSEDYSLGTIVR